MSQNNKKFEQEAKEFFADKKNANSNSLYVTSDGNMFRAEHYADDWKKSLTDKEVEVYRRDPIKVDISTDESVDNAGHSSTETSKGSEDAVREELVKQYIELFDTRPAHNIGLEKLQDKITAKRIELEKEAEIAKHIVTEDDLKNNPDLVEEGVKAGDEITLPNE